MRTPAEIMDDAYGYFFVTLSGSFIGVFSNMLAGIIRAGGDSFSPLIFFIVGIVSNIFLDILCVVVFNWGVRGAAAASVFSQFISCVLIFFFMIRRFSRFLPNRQDWIGGRRDFGVHLALGMAMGLQQSIVEAGNILVQAAVNGLGALAVAAVSAGQRVRGLNMMPLFAVSRAMTTYTAQNYGAGKTDRVNKGIFQACIISLGLGVFMAAINQFTGAPITALFLRDSPEAMALAHRYILYTGYTVFILGIMLVLRSSLQGLGMRRAPILCGVMETAMSVLAAFVLIPRFGFTGVCLVNPLSWLASGFPLYIAFGMRKKYFIKNRD
jgi:putative MATE family efflux protein